MKYFRTWLTAVPFCTALLTPVTSTAADHDRDDRVHRYYDGDHKDYHQWNAQEQRYWQRYWINERRPHVSWDRANEEQRRAYWRWRHEQEHHRDRRY